MKTLPNYPRRKPGSLLAENRAVGLPGRRFRLSATAAHGGLCLYSSLPDNFQLSEDASASWVTLTRTGQWNHPQYGQFSITPQTLSELVRNFDAGTYGQDISIDVGHDPDGGSAGRIARLSVEGNRLKALIEWTPWGRKQVSDKGFRYFSVDFHDNWEDPENGVKHGPVLFGAALTTRPWVKRLEPVMLSEQFTRGVQRVLIHPELRRQLSEFVETTKMKWLEQLRKRLSSFGLAEAVVKQLCESAKAAATHLGEDEAALKNLSASFEATGKTLSESIGDKAVTLSINLPQAEPAGDGDGNHGGVQLSEEMVAGMVSKQLKAAEDKAAADRKQLADRLDDRRRVLSGIIDDAKLEDADKAELKKQLSDLVTDSMTDDQIRQLAEFQISQAHKVAAARKLGELGYSDSRRGSPSISIDDASSVRKLSECIREHLAKTTVAQFGGLRLPKNDNPFVSRVLSEFDRIHAGRLDLERRVLSGEVSVDNNTQLPVGFVREVIREALSDLNILALLQQMTDFGATTTFQIPYEERQIGGILNDGIVYEGQGIPSAGIEQKMDNAYIVPMKLAMALTNEVMHFTRASGINWDAWARNAESNTRAIRELLQRRIANELLRASDSFASIPVTAENIAAQLDGSTHTIKTEHFPIVKPKQVRDISGNAIGAVQNPIVIAFGATNIPQWDGTGTQAAGTYFRVTDVNLGYIQFVDKDGEPVTPDEATATLGYSRATNFIAFDTKFDAAETSLSAHWDGALRAVGNRKAALNGQRQVLPDFALLSPTLEDEVTNAKGFVPLTARPGASANDATGDLERVKGLPMFTTNAPQLDMGDSRILIGQRGVGAYGISKPWMIGQPFEAVNGQGQPTGKKVAYGEEYNVVHVPEPVKYRYTSVLVYNSDTR